MWSSWPWVMMQPSTRSAFSRSQVKSGRTRSTPSISASGNMSPQSRIMRRSSCSTMAQLRPISPSPPRKVIRTGAVNCLSRRRARSGRRGRRWASSSRPAGAGPIGRRHWPTASPRARITALAGMGLGAASLDSKAKDWNKVALTSRARWVSPLAKAAIISDIWGPTQWVATPTTPTAPTASRARVRSSLPL